MAPEENSQVTGQNKKNDCTDPIKTTAAQRTDWGILRWAKISPAGAMEQPILPNHSQQMQHQQMPSRAPKKAGSPTRHRVAGGGTRPRQLKQHAELQHIPRQQSCTPQKMNPSIICANNQAMHHNIIQIWHYTNTREASATY